MTQTQHTPGPWKIRPQPDKSIVSEHNGDPFTIECDGDRFIAAIKTQSSHTEANAHLIAAAPDMLDFIRKVAAWDFGKPGYYGKKIEIAQSEALALIKKVRDDHD